MFYSSSETAKAQRRQVMHKEELNKLSAEVVDACITVHRLMGPGLLESVYELCLFKELELRNINVVCQKSVPLIYKDHELSKDYRIDILVNDEIIVEIKAIEAILPVHEAQLISYLRLANKRLGFLVNFNVPLMKNGIKRYVNNF